MIFTCGQHVELLKLINMLEVVQIGTHRCRPLLIDLKAHHHLCKMMLQQSYEQWDVGQLLPLHPVVCAVWHPYNFAVTVVYRLFRPLKLVERVHTGFQLAYNVYIKLALLHRQKSVLAPVLAAKDIQGRLDTRLQPLEGRGQDRRAGVLLQGLKTLIFLDAPVLLKIGTLVRGCN